ncbi:class I SAM-dependent methyltransferase [Glaciihabitans sp. UYNi722]|uniref:class I SAM-dependent methyltransferase n=1 Tax=Glaciihabitans sp. UYNi722 TaxID=3156344 RepID=UPI003392FAA6
MTSDDSTSVEAGFGSASFWEPRHLAPSAWREHAPFGYWLISATRPRTIVELGTHNGFSFFVFAEAVKRLGLGTRLFAIDSWQGDDQAGFYGEDVYQSVVRIASKDYADSTELIRSYFSDAVSRFEDGSIDLLHIDGRHGYEDVREDFETYRPKLSSRAVVVFHDTHEFQPTFGVHKFWGELSLTAPSFEFHHGHGLGVLAFGAEVPREVREFLAAGAADPVRMRRAYEVRGAEVSALFAQGEHLTELEKENANLRHELLWRDAALGQSRAELDQVRASTSWRLTAPLRFVGRKLRRSN